MLSICSRWIFNLIHGFLIGLGVEFLACELSRDSHLRSCDPTLSLPPDTNIGIGVSIFSETESDFGDLTIFWVYLAFAIFGVLLNSGLLLFFTFEAFFKGAEGVSSWHSQRHQISLLLPLPQGQSWLQL